MSREFPKALQGLLRGGAYPHGVEAVHVIATHISWVLLTGEFAYKIKRPVHYPFVDLRSASQRAFLCSEELRLNRRFAPDLYLEVCPITVVDGEARIGGAGPRAHTTRTGGLRLPRVRPRSALDRCSR